MPRQQPEHSRSRQRADLQGRVRRHAHDACQRAGSVGRRACAVVAPEERVARRHARRVLQERAAAGTLRAETRSRLRALAGLEDAGAPSNVPRGAEYHDLNTSAARLRLLWALHVVSGLTEADALALVRHADEHVRAWTVQLATEDGAVSPAIGDALVAAARADASPVVRLYWPAPLSACTAERWSLVEALHARCRCGRSQPAPDVVSTALSHWPPSIRHARWRWRPRSRPPGARVHGPAHRGARQQGRHRPARRGGARCERRRPAARPS